MKRQILFIKADRQLVLLLKDISIFTKEITQRKKLSPSWLRFAKRRRHGYLFLKNKKLHHDLLNEIVDKISAKHPHIIPARIADMLSELANTTVADAIMLNGLRLGYSHDNEEKGYMRTSLIYLGDKAHYIPRYPWFIATAEIRENTWKAKNITSGLVSSVSKKLQGDFFEYEIQEANLTNL